MPQRRPQLSVTLAPLDNRALANLTGPLDANLRQIEAALDKIKHGKYGRCESCDKAIAPLRLKALPYATECINCARSGERHGANSGKHSPINRLAAYRGEDENEPSHEAYEEIR